MRRLNKSCLIAFVLTLSACATTSSPHRQIRPPALAVEQDAGLKDPSTVSANAVAFRALSLVGTPYVYGGESPQTGFDCSGFVRFIYRDALGLSLARTAQAQSGFGHIVHQRTHLRLGDLVFFGVGANVFHVGLYVGDGRFVHAPRTGKNVQLSSLSSDFWATQFAWARRVL
jgi:cell wall-associated NlpC family hydrolase